MEANLSIIPELPTSHRIIHELECRVKVHERVNSVYRLLVLSTPPQVLDCKPGQFFHLLCPQTDRFRTFLRRPMSVYAYCQTGREISFLYKVVGAGTNALADLKPRELLNIVGPLGNGFAIRPEWQRPLLLARGVGLATLVPLAQKLSAINRPLVVICSARSPELLMSTEIFRQYGAEVITVTDTEGSSSIESLTHLIDRIIQRHDIDVFYTCGSKRLVHLLQKFGALYGISGQVALEQQMACGIGMCQACVVSCRRDDRVVSLRVCRDGPVFDLQEAS